CRRLPDRLPGGAGNPPAVGQLAAVARQPEPVESGAPRNRRLEPRLPPDESHAMTAFRLNRRAALGLLAGPVLLPLARRARAQNLDKLSFNTDWRAQAEHG